MKYTRFYNSPVGKLAMVTDGNALNAILLEKEIREENVQESEGKLPQNADNVFELAACWLNEYFAGKKMQNPSFSEETDSRVYSVSVGKKMLMLKPEGSKFRHDVWRFLCEIPYGETVLYGDIAARIAQERGITKMSAQAVGGAVGHNPVSIMIPCHRVMGTDGNLTGYGGGIPVKIRLLELEGADISKFKIPVKGTKL